MLQADINLFGMTCLQQISDRNVGGGIHVETGIWANVQATTNPQEVATVAPDALAAEIDATFWIETVRTLLARHFTDSSIRRPCC